MKRKFEFEFDDASANGTISFEYNEESDEKMSVVVENGVSVIYANRQAFMFLTKIFAKIALGEYQEGFHLHFYQDFDADQPEALRVVLVES